MHASSYKKNAQLHVRHTILVFVFVFLKKTVLSLTAFKNYN